MLLGVGRLVLAAQHSRRCFPARFPARAHAASRGSGPLSGPPHLPPAPPPRQPRRAPLSHGRKRAAAPRPAGPAQESVSCGDELASTNAEHSMSASAVWGRRGRAHSQRPTARHFTLIVRSLPSPLHSTQHPPPAPTRHSAQPCHHCQASHDSRRVRPAGRVTAAPGRRAHRAICAAPAAGGQGGAGGGEGGGGRAGCESRGGETGCSRTLLPRRDPRARAPPARCGLHWRRPTHRRPPRSRAARLSGEWAHHARG